MARGTQFRELLNMLRAELGHSLNRSTGINSVEGQKYALKNTYQWLYDSFDWRFLKIYTEENLKKGQRFYSFDARLDYENVERVWTYHAERWEIVEFGITPGNYEQFKENEEHDPCYRWDAVNGNQYEVWPVPASDGKLRMFGLQKFKQLVDEKDKCEIDDLLVVWFTAARMQKGAKNGSGQLFLDLARDRMRRVKAKSRAVRTKPFVLGGGDDTQHVRLRPGLDYMPERR